MHWPIQPAPRRRRNAERRGDGVSHPHEPAYRDELTDAVSRFGLRYHPTASRPEGHPKWTGLTGGCSAAASFPKSVA